MLNVWKVEESGKISCHDCVIRDLSYFHICYCFLVFALCCLCDLFVIATLCFVRLPRRATWSLLVAVKEIIAFLRSSVFSA